MNILLGHAFTNSLIESEYKTKFKCETMENHQEKTLEQIHQYTANIVRTFDLKDNYLDEDDPFVIILQFLYGLYV